MKIDYTKEDARAIERYYFDMIWNMKHPLKGRARPANEIGSAEGAMFHALAVCGVKFVALGNGGAFRVLAPDGNEFKTESEVAK